LCYVILRELKPPQDGLGAYQVFEELNTQYLGLDIYYLCVLDVGTPQIDVVYPELCRQAQASGLRKKKKKKLAGWGRQNKMEIEIERV
jgi:hypothetical protein